MAEKKIFTQGNGVYLGQKINELLALKADKTSFTTLDGKVTTLIGEDNSKSVRTIANEELVKQLIPETAKESLDTLGEIAAWIQAHPEDASEMNNRISTLETAVGKPSKDAEGDDPSEEATGLYKEIADAKSALASDIDKKVDKIEGKGLSTNDYTNDAKEIVDKISTTYETKEDAIASRNTLTSAINEKATKATTLGGYGITDAKIEGHLITLGDSTITPLTNDDFEEFSTDEIDAWFVPQTNTP